MNLAVRMLERGAQDIVEPGRARGMRAIRR